MFRVGSRVNTPMGDGIIIDLPPLSIADMRQGLKAKVRLDAPYNIAPLGRIDGLYEILEFTMPLDSLRSCNE